MRIVGFRTATITQYFIALARDKKTSISIELMTNEDPLVIDAERTINSFNDIGFGAQHSRYPKMNGEYHELQMLDHKALIVAVDNIDTVFYGLSAMIDIHFDLADEFAGR